MLHQNKHTTDYCASSREVDRSRIQRAVIELKHKKMGHKSKLCYICDRLIGIYYEDKRVNTWR